MEGVILGHFERPATRGKKQDNEEELLGFGTKPSGGNAFYVLTERVGLCVLLVEWRGEIGTNILSCFVFACSLMCVGWPGKSVPENRQIGRL